ncbi:chloride channel protein [Sphingobium sp. H39-3-25]|uniref:chloride channel protein n=1 Tax=Sphingobium arseniciresistens TaxID=3030834 RepID=UPI0023B9E02B|nr:chloride channel protein [Sphingobium arseniciresistens]
MNALADLLLQLTKWSSFYAGDGRTMLFFLGPLLGAAALIILRAGIGAKPLVDPLEANALHGGRMSWRDGATIAAQTILSNGSGASVGLEAAYAQCGATIGSKAAVSIHLRRADVRILVASGAAGAISAAFGAPIAGMFYGCELILATYSVPVAGAVFGASVCGSMTARLLGIEPYQIAPPPNAWAGVTEYVSAIGIAIICSALAILTMWFVVRSEAHISRRVRPAPRLLGGGVALGALIAFRPQAMGSGHEAMHALFLGLPALSCLLALLVAKWLASTITLATGFRGGLFFASLYLGALTGACVWAIARLWVPIDPTFMMLIGVAGFASAVLGTPLAIAFLVFESTGTFSIIGPVLVAAVGSNLLVRQLFGFSYSTWRLHLRGEDIESAMDIGWQRQIKVEDLMLTQPRSIFADTTIAEFRERYPLGASVNTIVLMDYHGYYKGLIYVPVAHDRRYDEACERRAIEEIAVQADCTIDRGASILEAMNLYRQVGVETIAVTDRQSGKLAGLLREASVVRRYAAEVEQALSSVTR